ncbi:MAG: hypothetical protein DCC75_06825 [Proteobacteria bacterium]|nr:MAG: hypothetical protein DCC75_06825 [Pseudomonadota bacterium]
MANSLLRGAYSVLGLALSILVVPVFLLSSRGRARLAERFGSWNLELDDCIWFHGASFGEVNGVIPIMRRIKASANCPSLLTSTSVSGLEKGAAVTDHQRLLPFDNPLWLGRALKAVRPRCLIIAETEIWPALLEYVSSRGIPVFIVNARISDYSWPRYLRLKFLIAPLLKIPRAIFAASPRAKSRLEILGASPALVTISGNTKYEAAAVELPEGEASKLRERLFMNSDALLVLGSLRPGEEKVWFPAIRKALDTAKRINFLVAPRHKEKFQYFKEGLTEVGIAYQSWREVSAGLAQRDNGRVLILDTLGELSRMYAVCQAAFIGGTLCDYGGHNPFEPAPYGAALAIGPFTSTISDEVELLKSKEALIALRDGGDIEKLLDRLDRSDPELVAVGMRSKEVWQSFSGSSAQIAEEIMRGVAANA